MLADAGAPLPNALTCSDCTMVCKRLHITRSHDYTLKHRRTVTIGCQNLMNEVCSEPEPEIVVIPQIPLTSPSHSR